ncbi:MAG: hypothetical protein KDN19_09435 [Verrucomicrobiae bacterium]|nr:hypothetical protein [Verrucomicrobiae bacterium]
MGFTVGWIGFETDSPKSVLDELGLAETPNPPEFHPAKFGKYTGVDLGNGWFALVFYGGLANWNLPLETLSLNRRIVCCDIYDRNNFSLSSSWVNGECIWEIEHFPEKGGQDYDPEHLEIKGSLPADLTSICDRLRFEQKTADFDLIGEAPTKVAEQITGFDVTSDRKKWIQMDLTVTKEGPMGIAEEEARKGCRQMIAGLVVIGLIVLALILWKILH